eukprot:4165235-Lingulodinium_polyedra.AAC.1
MRVGRPQHIVVPGPRQRRRIPHGFLHAGLRASGGRAARVRAAEAFAGRVCQGAFVRLLFA